MLHTIATVPVLCLIEWLELIAVASRDDVEPRLTEYLGRCRQTGYEPPTALLQLAREHIGRKRVAGSGTTTTASVRPKRGTP
jgi:hypothetical protein